MVTITIRKLDDAVRLRLRVRAAQNGRSMEAEAREILRNALSGEAPSAPDLAQAIRRHIEPLGGAELAIPKRQSVGPPPKLTG